MNQHVKSIVQVDWVREVGPNPHCFVYKNDSAAVNELMVRCGAARRNATPRLPARLGAKRPACSVQGLLFSPAPRLKWCGE